MKFSFPWKLEINFHEIFISIDLFCETKTCPPSSHPEQIKKSTNNLPQTILGELFAVFLIEKK